MATATIYIDGEILPENYIWPEETATSLIRVRKQFDAANAAGDITDIKLMIFSPGGYMVEGWAIYDYLLSLGLPIETVAYGQCASMATVFFCMGQQRRISPSCEFMVHLPWGDCRGNMHDIQEYLATLVAESEKLITFYNQVTGMDTAVLAEKMRSDWFMTPPETVTNKFATEIFSPGSGVLARMGARKAQKPVFLVDLKGKKEYKPEPAPVAAENQSTMSKLSKILADAASGILAVINGAPLKAMSVTTDDGKTLEIESTGEMFVIGDAVMLDGAPAPDGDYTLSDGRIITVTSGVISAITDPNTSASQEDAEGDAAQASAEGQSEPETVTISKSEYDALLASKDKVDAVEKDYKAFKARTEAVLGQMISPEVTVTAAAGKTVDTTTKNKGQEQPAGDAVARKQARMQAKNGK